MPSDTPFFRVRWVLQARSAWALPEWPHAVLYALLCEAAGDPPLVEPHMPDGLLLDAPGPAPLRVAAGETFAFGATLIEPNPARAAQVLHQLAAGLRRHGQVPPQRSVALGGNFDLIRIEDTVTGEPRHPGEPFQALPRQTLIERTEHWLPHLGRPLRVRFVSPLRLELPEACQVAGHRFADASCFLAGQFLRTVQKRLATIGMVRGEGPEELFADTAIELVMNRLVWRDVPYGPSGRRKTLGGVVGDVAVIVKEPVAMAALVWGEAAHVGRNLHYGFGRYTLTDFAGDAATGGAEWSD